MVVWKSIPTEEEGNIPETEDKEFDNQTSSANNNDLKSSEDYNRGEYSDDANSVHILIGDKNFHVGQQVDVLDSVQRWSEAEIVKIDKSRRRVYVTFLYWDKKWDTWITDIDNHIAPLNTHTYFADGPLKCRQRVDCKDNHGRWLEAFIQNETEEKVLIHYKSFHPKFDEWIPRKHDGRIQPYSRRKRLMNRHNLNRNSNKQPTTTNITNGSSSSSHQWNIPNEHTHADDRTRQIQQFSDKFAHYLSALQRYGLHVIAVPGDGNCLFRAISHQVYGDDSFHYIVRAKCMDYMEADAGFFSQFVVGGLETFPQYLAAKRKIGCWGDDPEIQALCELYERPAEIWAYDSVTGARKLRTFHEAAGGLTGRQPMRVSYYGGGHYDSIVEEDHHHYHRDSNDPLALEHTRKLQLPPGVAEDACISRLLDRNTALSLQSTIPDEREEKQEIEEQQLQRTEQAEIDLAIQSSRIDMEAWGDEDLETTLALSASANDMSSDHRKLPETISSATTTSIDDNNNNVHIQSPLLENISTTSSSLYPPLSELQLQRDSSHQGNDAEIDKELLATILQESLTQHTQETMRQEEALLEEVNLRSLCDSIVDNESKDIILDEDMEIAIQLSRLEEEKEEVTAALRQSLTEEDPSYLAAREVRALPPGVGGTADGQGIPVPVADTEEEMLQLAIKASLVLQEGNHHGASSTSSTYYPDNNYIYSSSMYNDYDFESAEDLDLRLALEASLED